MNLTWRQIAEIINKLPEALKDNSAIVVIKNPIRLDDGSVIVNLQSPVKLPDNFFLVGSGSADGNERVVNDLNNLSEDEQLLEVIARSGWFALGD